MSLLLSQPGAPLASLTDAAKLCFGAAAGFAIVGGGAWLAALFLAAETRLTGLVWVAMFYFILGGMEQLKQARSQAKHTARADFAPGRAPETEEQRSRMAA